MYVRKRKQSIIGLLVGFCVLFAGCSSQNVIGDSGQVETNLQKKDIENDITLENLPEFSGAAYIELNDNKPNFTKEDYTTKAFEYYSELDSDGRCGVAYANICKEIMPTEKRGEIGMVKPSGWHTVKYDIVDGKYLYNRCHLIGYQLAGENANEKNLITGTRYLNIEGMLPFENKVADYVNDTGNHVLYRVTPVFDDDDLVAKGVEMEGWSVEDQGEGISFHVFAYNSQPGITIDYENGESCLSKEGDVKTESHGQDARENRYIINKNTNKFHLPACSSAEEIKGRNKKEVYGTREELIKQGYDPCNRCKP